MNLTSPYKMNFANPIHRFGAITILLSELLAFGLVPTALAAALSTRQYSLQGELNYSFFKGTAETYSEKLRCEVLRDGEFLRIATCKYGSNFPATVFLCDSTIAFTYVQYRSEDPSAGPSEPGTARAWNNASVYVSSYRLPSYMLGKLTPIWLMTQGATERVRIGTNNPWVSVFGCTWPSSEFFNQPKTIPSAIVRSLWPDGFVHFAESFEFSDPQDPETTVVQEETFDIVGWTNCAGVKFPAGFAASVKKKARRATIGEPKPISEARFTFLTSKVDPAPAVRWETRAPRLSDVGDMGPFERGELPNGLSYHSTNGIIYSDPAAESKQHGLRVIPLIVETLKPGGPRVGGLAPDFKVKTLDGADHKLTDFRGKYVLLNFWATWCGPCLGEIPDLKATYDEFAQKGQLVMVGLSLDDRREQLVSFVENKRIGWPQAMLTGGFASPIAKNYGVDAIPAVFLVGPEGKFIFCYHSGHGINQAVASTLSRKGIDRDRP